MRSQQRSLWCVLLVAVLGCAQGGETVSDHSSGSTEVAEERHEQQGTVADGTEGDRQRSEQQRSEQQRSEQQREQRSERYEEAADIEPDGEAPESATSEFATSAGRTSASIAETIRHRHGAFRACIERARADSSSWRCVCDTICTVRFLAAEGRTHIRYPFVGTDGLAFEILADGSVARCSFSRTGSPERVDVSCSE